MQLPEKRATDEAIDGLIKRMLPGSWLTDIIISVLREVKYWREINNDEVK